MTDIFGLLKGKPEDSDYENKGVIVQGITGAYGSLHAKQMICIWNQCSCRSYSRQRWTKI